MTALQRSRLKRVRVLYEDEDILAVDKPYAMPVHGGAGPKRTTLHALLEDAYESSTPLTLVHRLDAETTGVIVLAKHTSAARAMHDAWPTAHKRYDAVVHGRMVGRVSIDEPLRTPDGRPQKAVTHVVGRRVLAPLDPPCSWVSVTLQTGRKHQIRRHLAARGNPVVGDDRHGDFQLNRALGRHLRAQGHPGGRKLLLHATELRLRHPQSDAELKICASFPPRFVAVLQAGGVQNIASDLEEPLP